MDLQFYYYYLFCGSTVFNVLQPKPHSHRYPGAAGAVCATADPKAARGVSKMRTAATVGVPGVEVTATFERASKGKIRTPQYFQFFFPD